MVWLGLLLGLLTFQALRFWPSPPPFDQPPALQRADPWAEAERSHRILAGQEGPPGPAMPASGRVNDGFTAFPAGVRVIDGDTFDLGGERIRVVGIDTPETHPAHCAHEADLGARATRRLGELLAAGPFELVPIDRDEDHYGRKLRRVVRGGRDLGAILIAEGLARPYGGGARQGWCA